MLTTPPAQPSALLGVGEMTNSRALPQGDRATHERNPQAVSAVPVGIPSAESRMTVGFVMADKAASERLWRVLQKLFAYRSEKPIRVFALSASDMFSEQEVIDIALDSDMDGYDLRAFLADVPCCPDLDALLDEWELPHSIAQAIEARRAETGTGSTEGNSPVAESHAPKGERHD